VGLKSARAEKAGGGLGGHFAGRDQLSGRNRFATGRGAQARHLRADAIGGTSGRGRRQRPLATAGVETERLVVRRAAVIHAPRARSARAAARGVVVDLAPVVPLLELCGPRDAVSVVEFI
jgi:hypothetical protein